MSVVINVLKKIGKILQYKKYMIKYKKSLIINKNVYIPKSTIIRINNGGKIVIGNNVELREHVVLNATNGGIIELQDNVFINDFSCINAQARVLIGQGTQLGQSVKIYDHDHDYLVDDFKHQFKKNAIYIGNNSWIGSNVCILRGSIVGSNCVIGAGCVVKDNIEDNTLLYEKREREAKLIKRCC